MSRVRKIGLLGGTFDPIHNGHLALARAARRRFRLDLVLVIPCGLPPHKSPRGISPFLHRYAMVALGCSGEKSLTPSLLEAGPDLGGRRKSYSADTIAAVRRSAGKDARLFFVMGADQFPSLPSWRNFRRMAAQCEFIVAARPGFSLAEAREILPAHLLSGRASGDRNTIALRGSAVHLMPMRAVDLSARELRRAIRRGGRSWKGAVPDAVADYIESAGLYRARSRRGRTG